MLPDLAFDDGPDVVVRNIGRAPANAFRLRIGERVVEGPSLNPGEAKRFEVRVEKRTLLDIDCGIEADRTNNSRFVSPD